MENLLTKDILRTEDFFNAFPDRPAQTVYSRIRKLVKEGKINVVGKGVYSTVPKLEYHPVINQRMREVANVLERECSGINFCITNKCDNLALDVGRPDMDVVCRVLKGHGMKTLTSKEADKSPVPPEGYIIVGPYISEMPVVVYEGIEVSSLEKEIVDSIGKMSLIEVQKLTEAYRLNYNRMERYASRRGVKEELKALFDSLDQERIKMISAVQKYFVGSAVTKAWVFGSFARGEETPESDLDLLVEYDKSAKLSLLGVIRYKLDLEKETGREIDIIENGYLRNFAVESANRDKYLIYER